MIGNVPEIEIVMEFYLEDGVMDGLSTGDERQIAEHMKNSFDQFNPFENPETVTTVEFQKATVCENEKTHELDETDEACYPKESSSRRKRRESEQWRKVEKSTVVVVTNFEGTNEEFVQWSSRQTQQLETKLLQATANSLTPEAQPCLGELERSFVTRVLSKMTIREPFPRAISPLFEASGSSFELHNWMAYLSPKMRKVPFTMLAIPGSHNSATHTMQKDKEVPDGIIPYPYDSPLYTNPDDFKSFVTSETLASWGRCVDYNINEQLEMGIRYFDFRPQKHYAYRYSVFNAHYLYAARMADELAAIKDFLVKYPTEVVIVHMNHGWQEMDENQFEQLNTDIQQM